MTREMEVMRADDAETLGVPRGATALRWGGGKQQAKKRSGGGGDGQSVDEWMRDMEAKANDAGEL